MGIRERFFFYIRMLGWSLIGLLAAVFIGD